MSTNRWDYFFRRKSLDRTQETTGFLTDNPTVTVSGQFQTTSRGLVVSRGDDILTLPGPEGGPFHWSRGNFEWTTTETKSIFSLDRGPEHEGNDWTGHKPKG